MLVRCFYKKLKIILQQLRSRCGYWHFGGSRSRGAAFHAAAAGHAFGTNFFLGFFALCGFSGVVVGHGGTNEGEQSEGEQGIFHNRG